MVDAKIKETYVVAISSSLWGQNKLHTLEDGLVDQMPQKAIDHMCELDEWGELNQLGKLDKLGELDELNELVD